MKKTWEVINNVLVRKLKNTKPITFIKDPNDNDSVTSDPSRIANVLNDHFASVGPKLANKLPTVQRKYFDFLNRSNSPDSSFAFNLITPAEVESEILCIPINKSHGLYSCPTQLLKYSSNVISSTLAEIINLSISAGMYTTKLKMAKIIPIFKAENNTNANNYTVTIGLFLCCLTLIGSSLEWNLSLRKMTYFLHFNMASAKHTQLSMQFLTL